MASDIKIIKQYTPEESVKGADSSLTNAFTLVAFLDSDNHAQSYGAIFQRKTKMPGPTANSFNIYGQGLEEAFTKDDIERMKEIHNKAHISLKTPLWDFVLEEIKKQPKLAP